MNSDEKTITRAKNLAENHIFGLTRAKFDTSSLPSREKDVMDESKTKENPIEDLIEHTETIWRKSVSEPIEKIIQGLESVKEEERK